MYVRISVDSRPHRGELRASYARAGNELCDLKNRRRLVADVKNTFRVSASFGRLQQIAGDPENSHDARRNIGQTGRTFGKRLEEHRKEADNSEAIRYTRSQKQQAQKEEKKSAVTDHVARNNCVIDWEGARVIDREDNRRIRWIKEAVWIRKSTPVMNRDEGGYKLSHVWDCILAAKAPPTLALNSGELQNSSQKL
ncbi:hypothetical protein Bbelb_021210 [Branchiostoma belcheri]|nr:hypothetical protein Bbelb_021210 [Branchiostoma belcheri]